MVHHRDTETITAFGNPSYGFEVRLNPCRL
jgi:hypothetical protein